MKNKTVNWDQLSNEYRKCENMVFGILDSWSPFLFKNIPTWWHDNVMIIIYELSYDWWSSCDHMMTMTHCQDHILSENIWFLWSKTSYSGDKWRCHRGGTDGWARKDSATQLLICALLSFASAPHSYDPVCNVFLKNCLRWSNHKKTIRFVCRLL